MHTQTFLDLAAAVADGRVPDWDAAESNASPDERPLVAHLRSISAIGVARATAFSTHGDGVPSDAVRALRAGDTWGPLRVVAYVGRGRFGDVYRAWDPALEREVALKLLQRPADASDTGAGQVVEEGRLMARVRHPNVATIHGAQTVAGETALWMEFVEGRTLADDLSQRGTFGPSEIGDIGLALCDALGAVHTAGLVHRDVKAQNVLREASGRVVLGDFGASRMIEDEATGLAGTPSYLAPELFGQGTATPRSDVYSLGVLLYHLATGSFPVPGGTLGALRAAHEAGRRTTLRSVRPDWPASLTSVIDRAIAPAPSERFAGAADMAAALRAALASERTPERPRRFLWFAAAFALVVAALVFATLGARPPLPLESRDWLLVTAIENRTGNPDLDATLEYALARELSASAMVNVVPRGRVEDALALMRKPSSTRVDERTAREVALRDGHIRLLLAGSVEREGSGYVISTGVQRVSDGAVLASLQDRSRGEADLIDAAGRLVRRLRGVLGERAPVAGGDAQPLARVTTRSLRALQLYSRASEIFGPIQGWQNSEPGATEQLLRQALAEDPEFASAHLLLAEVILQQPPVRWAEVTGSVQKARATASRAPDLERLFIEGTASLLEGFIARTEVEARQRSFERAAAAYEALRSLSPDDQAVLFPLARVYRDLNRRPEAHALERHLADVRPANAGLQIRAAMAAVEEHDMATAHACVQRARTLASQRAPIGAPGSAWIRLFEAYEAWLRNDPVESLRVTDAAAAELPALEPGSVRQQLALHVLCLYNTLGRLDEAEASAVYWSPDEQEQVWATAQVLAQRDDPKRLAAYLRERLEPEVMARRLGSILVDAGLLDIARKYSAGPNYLGHLALAEGRLDDAIRDLSLALSNTAAFGDPNLFRLSRKLASALASAGRHAQAVDVLESASRQQARAAVGPSSGYEWLRVRADLALLLRRLGRVPDAQVIETELAALLAVAPDDHPIRRQLVAAAKGDARAGPEPGAEKGR